LVIEPLPYSMLADTFSGWWGIPGEGFDRKSIMAVYDRALSNVTDRAWSIYRKAECCLISDAGKGESTNHLDDAEKYFRELLKEDTQSYKGLLGLGQVNRLHGNYDDSEDYYRKAARVKPGEVEPRAGIWISLAYAGRAEESWNAMTEYYGAGQQMNTEAVRVASMLTTSRHYEAAARLYDRLVETAARPEIIQKLARLLRKTEKVKHDSYETFYDDTTPEALAQTLVIATLRGDTDKVFRCLSPAVNRSEARRSLQNQTRFVSSVSATLGTNYLADIILSAFDTKKRMLDDGGVEVKLDPSSSGVAALSSFASAMTLQVQAISNRWEAITMTDPELDYSTFGRLAIEALDGGDVARGIAWQTRLADLVSHPAQGRSIPPLAAHLREVSFTDDALRVKAWAGLGLLGSHDVVEIRRAIHCLEDVVAAYPGDSQLKIALAHGCNQVANVKKAGAILDTINISKIANPIQLGQLAFLEIELERLDAANKVITRMREVAPDDEQLMLIEALARNYRTNFADAAAGSARVRARSGVTAHA
jgi:tetratricopeptide (TPR) repeat protein